MADKSSGDSAKFVVKANPLLSSAVIGLSIEDFTHRAVLCPIPATSDAQDATEEQKLQHTTLSNSETKHISPSRNTNTLHFAPVHESSAPLNSDTPFTIAKSQIDTNFDNTTTHSNASDKSKKHDDFDVNEYFARLQGTRYVSAPLNTNLAEDINQNMPVEEESAFSDVNLCEDSQGNISNIGGDFPNSITADIAQNFSQLPQVLPQMASAVFSSFSSILNMNKPNRQDTVPSAPSYGHPDPIVHQSGSFTVDQSIRPPSIEMKPEVPMNPVPMFNATDYRSADADNQNGNTDLIGKGLTKPPPTIGSGNQYRLSSKKKTYAPVPSLQFGTQADKNRLQHPMPNLPPMPPLLQNTATTQSSFMLPNPSQNYSVPELEQLTSSFPNSNISVPQFSEKTELPISEIPAKVYTPNILVPTFSDNAEPPHIPASSFVPLNSDPVNREHQVGPNIIGNITQKKSYEMNLDTPTSILSSQNNEAPPTLGDAYTPSYVVSSALYGASNVYKRGLEAGPNLKSMPNIENKEYPQIYSLAPTALNSFPNIFVPTSIEIAAPLLTHQASSPSTTFDASPDLSSETVESSYSASSECSQSLTLSLSQKIANFKPYIFNPFGSSQPDVETSNPKFFNPSTLSQNTSSNFGSVSNLPVPMNSFSIDRSSDAPLILRHFDSNNPVSVEPPQIPSGNKFRLQNKKRMQYYSGPIDKQQMFTPKVIETPFPTPPQPFSNPLGSVSYFNPYSSLEEQGRQNNGDAYRQPTFAPQLESQTIQHTQEKQLSQYDTINVLDTIGPNNTPTMFNPYTSQEQNMSTHSGFHTQPESIVQPAQEDLNTSVIFTFTQLPPISKTDFEHNNVHSVFNPYSNQEDKTNLISSHSNIAPQTPENLCSASMFYPDQQPPQTNDSSKNTPSMLHPYVSPAQLDGNIEKPFSPEFNLSQNIAQPTHHNLGSISMFTPTELPNIVKDTFEHNKTPKASQPDAAQDNTMSDINNQLDFSRQLNAESQEKNPQTQENCNPSIFSSESSIPSIHTFEHTTQEPTNIPYPSSNEAVLQELDILNSTSTFIPTNDFIQENKSEESKASFILNPHPDFTSSDQMIIESTKSEISQKSYMDNTNITLTHSDNLIQTEYNFEPDNSSHIFNSDSTSSVQHILENTDKTHNNNLSSTSIYTSNNTPIQAKGNFDQYIKTLPIPISDQQKNITDVHIKFVPELNRDEHNISPVTENESLNTSFVDSSTIKDKDNIEHTNSLSTFQEDTCNLSAQIKDHFLNSAFEDVGEEISTNNYNENVEDMERSDVRVILNDIEREISNPTSDLRDNLIEDMKIGDYMHFGLPQNEEEGSNIESNKSKKIPANASDEYKAVFKNIITRDKKELLENISFREDDSKEVKNSDDLDEIKKIPISELTQKQFEYLADNARDSQSFHKDYYEKFDIVATTDDDKLVRNDNDIQKFDKLNIAESTNIQSSFYKQSISSPVSVGSFTSYFDTGNFAVENYLKNNQTVSSSPQNTLTHSNPDIIESTRNVETSVSQTVEDSLNILPDPLQFFNATDFETPKENTEENLLAKYFSFPQKTSNSSNSRPISSFREDSTSNLTSATHSHTNSPVTENNSISFSSNSEQSPNQSFF